MSIKRLTFSTIAGYCGSAPALSLSTLGVYSGTMVAMVSGKVGSDGKVR